MASTNWQKATLSAAAAMILHFGKDEREEVEHANKHIDKSKSHLNVYIGADDYKPMLDKVKKRIKEVDKLYPPKRNMGSKRITCILLETPVPQEIAEQGRAEEFLRKTHELYENFFGAENVGGTCCHFDEQHLYTEPRSKEKKMSLIHGHTLIAAYAEWEDKKIDKKTGKKTTEPRKGINGKHCESRALLHRLNTRMNHLCKTEFGIDYNTGIEPRKEKVERLKKETEILEKTEKLKQQKANLEQEVKELNEKVSKANDVIAACQARENAVIQRENELRAATAAADQQLKARETALNAREKALDDRETALNAREKALDDRETALNQRESKLNERDTKSEQTAKAAEKMYADVRYKIAPVADIAQEVHELTHQPKGFFKRPKKEIDEPLAKAIEIVATRLMPTMDEFVAAPAQLDAERRKFEDEKADFEKEIENKYKMKYGKFQYLHNKAVACMACYDDIHGTYVRDYYLRKDIGFYYERGTPQEIYDRRIDEHEKRLKMQNQSEINSVNNRNPIRKAVENDETQLKNQNDMQLG